MLLFVIADFFRRRGPTRARDEIPLDPLVETLLFWVFFGVGALFGSVSIVASIAGAMFDAGWAGVASAACLYGAITMWRRLNH